ncbi:MAG: hypothetical protein MMC33_008130 [Icmadophila ericetorum]|nr:hypothetical protein [Icmadophila ericetorum]
MEDLINFDIIESEKENIQSLPGGRSAKALAAAFAPSFLSPAPTPGATRSINDGVRHNFELELVSIADADDPLDIYDRYVKWTLDAYPSSQASKGSQLRPLLERATKAFQADSNYKNDPRYLKLWLTYIRLFSESPRETYAYLARHGIGEGLALYYEEYAAWLEQAGRWNQADEVYKTGIERQVRPQERLLRKFGEFEMRNNQRPQGVEQPSSPPLPRVRAALVAKVDPFMLTPRPEDPQSSRPGLAVDASRKRIGRQKLTVFSDDGGSASKPPIFGGSSKGWDNIGSVQDRKKENTIEARPWAGETLRSSKKLAAVPKMMIFKDESVPTVADTNMAKKSSFIDQQQVVNPKTGRTEQVSVNLEAVYPNPTDPTVEFCFEELRAQHRGWLDKKWIPEKRRKVIEEPEPKREREGSNDHEETMEITEAFEATPTQKSTTSLENASDQILGKMQKKSKDNGQENKVGRPRKIMLMEVKAETQTIKTNLESPTGPRLKRKTSAEPTMTLHTRAATDDILDIFNQPLRNMDPITSNAESECESDFDTDDYTIGVDSTCTGAVSQASDFGEDDTGVRSIPDPMEQKSGEAWSDFTASKHLPQLQGQSREATETDVDIGLGVLSIQTDVPLAKELVTPVSPGLQHEAHQTSYILLPPEDYEAPTHPYRDPSQVAQSRLPFMTPIIEKTESSMGLPTASQNKDYFNFRTPSKSKNDGFTIDLTSDPESSPFQEIGDDVIEELLPQKKTSMKTKITGAVFQASLSNKASKGPIIKDKQCNPVDESVRNTILGNLRPPLSKCIGFYDHGSLIFNKAPEIRKFVKALTKVTKNVSEKTMTNLSVPPTLHFPTLSKPYTIRRELGKGAFAPVYLAEQESDSEDGENENDNEISILSTSKPARTFAAKQPRLTAIKCEHPPTPWEYYIMTTAHRRLGVHRATESLAKPYSMHLFADEGYLIEEYRDQGTLLDLVNIAKVDPSTANPTGVLDEVLVMFFTIELLRTVEALHSKGIIHGDLKADNCLARLPSPSTLSDTSLSPIYSPTGDQNWSSIGILLIDFGRGIDLRQFSEDVGFLADWKTSKSDCVEMRELRPWKWQADWWGIAGVVHVLLYGKWIEDVVEKGEGFAVGAQRKYKLKEGLKRYWQTELWAALFEALMNPDRGCLGAGGEKEVWRRVEEARRRMEEYLVVNGEKKGLRSGLRKLGERVRGSRK